MKAIAYYQIDVEKLGPKDHYEVESYTKSSDGTGYAIIRFKSETHAPWALCTHDQGKARIVRVYPTRSAALNALGEKLVY